MQEGVNTITAEEALSTALLHQIGEDAKKSAMEKARSSVEIRLLRQEVERLQGLVEEDDSPEQA